jgi:hypothetical protein
LRQMLKRILRRKKSFCIGGCADGCSL